MTESDVDQAVKDFNDGFSCSQAMMRIYGTKFGVDQETATRLGTGFAGGMARHAQVCGAVTGAIMVIGLKHGMTKLEDDDARTKTYELVAEFIKKFKEKNFSIICSELLGCDISTTEGRRFAQESNKFKTVCPEFVRDAAKILEEIL